MIRSLLEAGGVHAPVIELWEQHLQVASERFSINTRLRLIHWLATMIHESAGFLRLVENLNYGAVALLRLFPFTAARPWGFTPDEAAQFAHRPEQIANRIYADRMGNGNEASGEGWFYRGRGPIQITGRDNYRAASGPCGVDLLPQPERLVEPKYGAVAAGDFWQRRRCNELADADNIEAIRRSINGGTIGLEEVRAIVDRMKLGG